MSNLHNVYIFFPDGSYNCEGRGLAIKSAVERVHNFINRPAARLGLITRIIVTGEGDCTNFEWKLNEGITFPLTDVTRKWNEYYLKAQNNKTPIIVKSEELK